MQKVEYASFKADYRKTEYKNVNKNLSYSDHGYYITPEGDVYSLNNSMSHGRVAAAIHPELFEETIKEYADCYESTITTQIDLLAVSRLNWLRISIVEAIGDLNFSWGKVATPRQIAALEIIIDTHDPDREMEYWYDGGPGSLTELKAKIRETTTRQ